MIVLISSDYRVRYADDIVRLLALPKEGQMLFRYDEALLSDDVKSRLPRMQLAQEKLLVCFLTNNADITPATFVPVRFARIIRAERIGQSVLFTLAAEEFVEGVTDADIRSAASPADRARLSTLAVPGKIFGFQVNENWKTHRSSTLRAFEETAKTLSSNKAFASPSKAFYTVSRLARLQGESWYVKTEPDLHVHMGVYKLHAGISYECEVYCLNYHGTSAAPLVGPVAPPPVLAADTNSAWVEFGSVKRHAIDTKYDVKRFIFSTEPHTFRRSSGISLFLTGKIEAASSDYRQDILLPVNFGGSFWLGLARAAAIGSATAAPGMIAINAAGKLTPLAAGAALIAGLFAGLLSVYPILKPK